MKRGFFVLMLIVTVGAQSQIVNIPDANFKFALVNELVVDTDGDGVPDADADTNDDGEIQVSEAEVVQGLIVDERNIVSMEGIQSFLGLTYLDFSYNQVVTVNLSQNLSLVVLNCRHNDLIEIDVTNNVSLWSLYCGFNFLDSIDISNNLSLRNFSVRFNNLTEIDVSQNQNLFSLDCTANNLTQLDVTNNTGLSALHFGGNDVSEIDITQNMDLNLLTCSLTKITELDLSQHSNLSWVQCFGNERLNYLNIRNGNNSQLSIMWADQNPNLECILVDDPIYSSSQDCNYPTQGWCKDEDTIYSEDCILGANDFVSSRIIMYPNPVVDILEIASEKPVDTIKIYASDGKFVLIERNMNSINLSGLNKGLYFAEIRIDDTKSIQKFVRN